MFDSLILIIGLLLMFLSALGGWISERVYRKATLKEIKKQIRSKKHWLEERIKYEKDNKEIGVKRYFDEETNTWVNKIITTVDGKVLNHKEFKEGIIRGYADALEIIKEVLK